MLAAIPVSTFKVHLVAVSSPLDDATRPAHNKSLLRMSSSLSIQVFT